MVGFSLAVCFIMGFHHGVTGSDALTLQPLALGLCWIAAASALSVLWLRSMIMDLTDKLGEISWLDQRITALRGDHQRCCTDYFTLRQAWREIESNNIGALKEVRRRLDAIEEHGTVRVAESDTDQQIARLEDRLHRISVAIGKMKAERHNELSSHCGNFSEV
jgi:chromosome segregation ATPase